MVCVSKAPIWLAVMTSYLNQACLLHAMTQDESFLLVSLEEGKAKRLAQVISNDTSRKILDHLAKVAHATETDLSKHLHIPLSTVHYNMKALKEANLVKADEYHYSKKGKEILHYSLTNKIIIIAPKERKGLKEALQKFIPITLVTAAAAAILSLFRPLLGTSSDSFATSVPADEIAQKGLETAVMEPMRAAAPMLADEAVMNATANNTRQAIDIVVTTQPAIPDITLWFLAGAVFVIILFLLFELVSKARKR